MPISIAPSLAIAEDVDYITALIAGGSFQGDGSGELLPISSQQVAKLVSEGRFAVARSGGNVVGCVSLVEYGGIAELRSLVVAEGHRSHGIGTQLATWCVDEAAHRGYRKLFALTNAKAIGGFLRWGFVHTDRPPQKLSRDCQACPLFQTERCKEVAVVRTLEPER